MRSHRAALVGVSVAALVTGFGVRAFAQDQTAPSTTPTGAPSAGAAAAAQPSASAPTGTLEKGAAMEEVVVTARKRTERLIDVPVAATVLSGVALGKSGLTSLAAISQQVPTLIIAETGIQTGGSITLRGIGASNFNPTSDQLVSVNVDGVQVSQGQIIRLGQYDIGSLEVLKGPQTLFFGKNSPAGVISLNSADPTSTPEAQLRTGYEFEAKQRFVEGYVSGPIFDGLEGRIFAHYSQQDGYFKNVINPASGLVPNVLTGPETTDDFVRTSLKYSSPDGHFSARFKASYSAFTNNSGTQSFQQTSYCALGAPQLFGTLAPLSLASDCEVNQNYVQPKIGSALSAVDPKNFGDVQPYIRSKQALVSLELNYDFGEWAKLTSVTGYYGASEDEVDPFLSVPVSLLASRSDLHNIQFTEELRLGSNSSGRFNYLVGAFYQKARLTDVVPIAFGLALAPGLPVPFEEPIDDIGVDTNAYSAFGQLRYELLPKVELAVGARYSHEEKSLIGTVGGGTLDLPQFTDSALTNDPKRNFQNISPDVTLTYKPLSTLTLYAAYREGFVSGGFNTSAGQFFGPILTGLSTGTPIAKQTLSYGQTTNSGEEVGAKGYAFDRQVRFDLSVYNYDYTNLQVPQQSPDGITLSVKNAAAATTRGVELNSFIEPHAIRGLQIRAGVGYNDGFYSNFIGGCYVGQTIAQGCNLIPGPGGAFTAQNQSNQQLLRAPQWVVNAGFTYEHQLTPTISAIFAVDANHQTSFPTDIANDPHTRQAGYWQVNASVGVHGRGDAWALDLIGRNLANDLAKSVTFSSPFQGAGTGTTNGVGADFASVLVPPISIMLQLTVKSSILAGL